VRLFHYHLVTSKVRETEARYLGRLAFTLLGRYGRIGEEQATFESGVPWDELDRMGFRLRLSELQRGAVNVVVQPGHWEIPRVDHLGLALDEDEFGAVLTRANLGGLKVQEHAERRTFVATQAGFRLELHPPREWLDDLLRDESQLRLAELHLRADDPGAKAAALASVLGGDADGGVVTLDDTVVRFVGGGPQGRPELHGEQFSAGGT
jgi:hypothetical protein